jgi:hypothetical protein
MQQYLHILMLKYRDNFKRNIKYSEIDFHLKHVSCLAASQQGNMPVGEFVLHLFWIELGVPYKVVHTK